MAASAFVRGDPPEKGRSIMGDHTISVRGVGSVSWPPDVTVISFNVQGRSRDYSGAIDELNERVAVLRETLSAVEVDPKQLKTAAFDIHAEYRTVNKEQVFDAWRARHDLRLELDVDREKLNRALNAIATSGSHAQFTIHFEVRDRAGFRAAVIADATRTARRNAEAIAAAAGCRLGKVRSIDYNWSEIRFASMHHELAYGVMAERSIAAPDIEPEDVKGQDSVSVVFELLED